MSTKEEEDKGKCPESVPLQQREKKIPDNRVSEVPYSTHINVGGDVNSDYEALSNFVLESCESAITLRASAKEFGFAVTRTRRDSKSCGA